MRHCARCHNAHDMPGSYCMACIPDRKGALVQLNVDTLRDLQIEKQLIGYATMNVAAQPGLKLRWEDWYIEGHAQAWSAIGFFSWQQDVGWIWEIGQFLERMDTQPPCGMQWAKYLLSCVDLATEVDLTHQEAASAARWIRELAERRRRVMASLQTVALCYDLTKAMADTDRVINRLWQAARH